MRLVVAAAIAGLGIWGWLWLHPSPEQIIRKELANLARTACIPQNEGQLAKLANAQKLASFFTRDAEISIDVRGRFDQTITGREEVQEKALAARAMLAGLTVQFLDVSVVVDPDGQQAIAHLTGRANIPGESTPQVDEFKFGFKYVDGDWLINRIQNVKTLH
jgi:hypothetical protein